MPVPIMLSSNLCTFNPADEASQYQLLSLCENFLKFQNDSTKMTIDGSNKQASAKRDNWEKTINLKNIPTKAEDVECAFHDGSTLIISGKSEIEIERNGMKICSNHNWSKEFTIPKRIDHDSLSVKLVGNELRINGENKTKDIKIQIKNKNNTNVIPESVEPQDSKIVKKTV